VLLVYCLGHEVYPDSYSSATCHGGTESSNIYKVSLPRRGAFACLSTLAVLVTLFEILDDRHH
jgi:hypothetical protein